MMKTVLVEQRVGFYILLCLKSKKYTLPHMFFLSQTGTVTTIHLLIVVRKTANGRDAMNDDTKCTHRFYIYCSSNHSLCHAPGA